MADYEATVVLGMSFLFAGSYVLYIGDRSCWFFQV
jgi:hypothetical protein